MHDFSFASATSYHFYCYFFTSMFMLLLRCVACKHNNAMTSTSNKIHWPLSFFDPMQHTRPCYTVGHETIKNINEKRKKKEEKR